MVLMKSLPSLLPGRQRKGERHFLAAGRRRGGGRSQSRELLRKKFSFSFCTKEYSIAGTLKLAKAIIFGGKSPSL